MSNPSVHKNAEADLIHTALEYVYAARDARDAHITAAEAYAAAHAHADAAVSAHALDARAARAAVAVVAAHAAHAATLAAARADALALDAAVAAKVGGASWTCMTAKRSPGASPSWSCSSCSCT